MWYYSYMDDKRKRDRFITGLMAGVISLAVIAASLPLVSCFSYADSYGADASAGAASSQSISGLSGSAASDEMSICEDGGAEDLLMMYMEQQATGESQDAPGTEDAASDMSSDTPEGGAAGGIGIESSDRGARLSGKEKKIYNALVTDIKKIAAGNRKTAVVTIPLKKVLGKLKFTKKELGVKTIRKNGQVTSSARAAIIKLCSFDVTAIHSSLLADLPYELYWYDKSTTTGGARYVLSDSGDTSGSLSYSYNDKYIRFTGNPVITFTFKVSKDYSASGKTGTSYLRSDLASVSRAVSNARAIAARYAGETDVDKLTAFRDEICALASYDHDYESKDYGNPWQLVYVFDGDSSTEVVCEGYSKAFQFLCDISDFSSSRIKSRIVTGTLNYELDHMWNIVCMNDGRNHIVDLTNCDSGTVGYPDKLFLKPYSYRSSYDLYRYPVTGGSITYMFSSSTRNIYADSELEMSDSEYICPHGLEDLDDGNVTAAEAQAAEGEAVPAVLTYRCMVCGETLTAEYASAEEAEQARYERLALRYTPAKVSLTSVSPGSKKATVKWKRLAQNVTRYQIGVTDSVSGRTRTVTVKQGSGKTLSKVVKGLKKRKYKIKVRAYKTASGYTFYGKWSNAKIVKVK